MNRNRRHLWYILIPLAISLAYVTGCEAPPDEPACRPATAGQLAELKEQLRDANAKLDDLAKRRIILPLGAEAAAGKCQFCGGDMDPNTDCCLRCGRMATVAPVRPTLLQCPHCHAMFYASSANHTKGEKASAPDLRAALKDAFNLIIHLGHSKEEVTAFIQKRFGAIYDKRITLPPLTKGAIKDKFRDDIRDDINQLLQ